MPEVTAPQPAEPAPRRRWLARLLKALVAAVLAAVILVFGGLSILLLTFDPNQYKATLIQVVKEREQRTLELPGTIALELFPPLTLRTGPFALSERDSTAVFARADDLRLHLDLFALLRRSLVVDRIVMVRPQIHIVRDAQGRFNFADLLPQQPPGTGARSPLGLSVHRVQIEQGEITLDDLKTQVHGVLTALELQVSGLAGGNGSVQLGANARFTQPQLDSRIDLRANVHGDAAQHRVALSDLWLTVRGEGFGLKAMQSRIGAAQLVFAVPADQAAFAAQAQRCTLQTTARTADGRVLHLQASLPSADLGRDALRLGALHATMQLATLRALLDTAPAAGTWSALRIARLRLQARRESGQPLQLAVTSPLQLDLTQRRADLPQLDLAVQIGTANAGRAHTLTLHGDAHYAAGDGTAAAAQWQLLGVLDGSAVHAAGKWTHPDALDLDLSADHLRLDDWLPPAALPPAGKAPAAPAKSRIDLSWLRRVALQAQFRVGSLSFEGIQWNTLQGKVRSDRSVLQAQVLTAQALGGNLTASLHADLATQRFVLQQTARGLSVQPVVQALWGAGFLRGNADWTLDLAAQGDTVQALLASVSGKVRLDVRNGAIAGFDLLRLLHGARTQLAARRNRQTPIAAGQRTDFAALGATFQLRDGVARTSDLSLQSSLLRASGEGWFDLPRKRMDCILLPDVTAAMRGREGAEFAALRGVTVPVQLRGSFAQPTLTVLWPQAGGAALRQTLKTRLEQALVQERAPQQPRPESLPIPGLLKGLLP